MKTTLKQHEDVKKRSFKLSERQSYESLSRDGDINDPLGRIFTNNAGFQEFNKFNIVGVSTDTVRQLYTGIPKVFPLEQIQKAIEDKEQFFVLNNDISFHLSKMGKQSGYRYKLQNNEIGLVILFGSYYGLLDQEKSHLKIELSPKYILQFDAQQAQYNLDAIANHLLKNYKTSGVAIHIAVDFQGWQPDNDFLNNFITYSRFNRTYDGVTEMTLDKDWSGVSNRFSSQTNSTETYLFGKPTGLQTCLYLKSKEMVHSDKVDFYENEWNIYSLGTYDKEKPVWRLEYRYHHQILREVGYTHDKDISSYYEADKLIPALWDNACGRNRLEIIKGTIHPIWQMLLEDVQFPMEKPAIQIIRTKKKDQSSLTKNYSMIIGNMITVCARRGMDTRAVMKQLKSLEFYDDLLSNYRHRNLTESDLREQVDKGLQLRRMIGKVA